MFRRLLPLRCRFSTSTASSAAPTLYSNGQPKFCGISFLGGKQKERDKRRTNSEGQLDVWTPFKPTSSAAFSIKTPRRKGEEAFLIRSKSSRALRIVKDVVEGQSHNLLESVAHRIARATLLKFLQISAVRVKVGKPHVAVQGIFGYLSVEILRYRKDMGGDSFCTPIICTE